MAGVQWLLNQRARGHGGIIADEMGLGKTIQSITLLAQVRSQGSGPFLVLCPLSLVRYWATELARFVDGFQVAEGKRKRKRKKEKGEKQV